LSVPIASMRIIPRGDASAVSAPARSTFVSSMTPGAQALGGPARPYPETLVDVALVATVLAGALALLDDADLIEAPTGSRMTDREPYPVATRRRRLRTKRNACEWVAGSY
jgi:hypothetical protein